MNLEEIQQFAELSKEILTEQNQLARCVDGRYENMTDMPMLAKPGADAGDVMAAFGTVNILQISISPETILKSVLKVIGGTQNFRFHTDSHASDAGEGMGCGHLKQAKLDPASYGLTQEQIDFIFESLPELLTQGAEQVVLQGDHQEQAVIVVNSEDYGLKPLYREGDQLQEAFIYQKSLHSVQLEQLAKVLQEVIAATGQVVEIEAVGQALDQAFGKQLTETLNRLAKVLPVYAVTIDNQGIVTVNE